MSELNNACKNGNINEIKRLLDNGADVNAKDDDGYTPLISASAGGFVETAKFLLENGADMNAEDKYGWTSLMYASQNRHINMLKFLIENGADVNHKSIDGRDTALKVAYCEENDDILNLLRENGAEQLDDDDDCYCGKQASAGRKMCKDCYHQEYGY